MNLESKPTAWYSCMLTPRTEVPSELPSEHKLPSVARFEEFYVSQMWGALTLGHDFDGPVQCRYIFFRLLHLIQHYSLFKILWLCDCHAAERRNFHLQRTCVRPQLSCSSSPRSQQRFPTPSLPLDSSPENPKLEYTCARYSSKSHYWLELNSQPWIGKRSNDGWSQSRSVPFLGFVMPECDYCMLVITVITHVIILVRTCQAFLVTF